MRKFFNKIATKVKSSKKLMVGATVATIVSVTAVPAFAEDTATQTAMSTALGGVKSDAIGALGIIAPIAIGIMGAFLVWKFGIKFFKGLAK